MQQKNVFACNIQYSTFICYDIKHSVVWADLAVIVN